MLVLHSFCINVFISVTFLQQSNQFSHYGRNPVIIMFIWLLFLKSTDVTFIISFAIRYQQLQKASVPEQYNVFKLVCLQSCIFIKLHINIILIYVCRLTTKKTEKGCRFLKNIKTENKLKVLSNLPISKNVLTYIKKIGKIWAI